MANFEISTFDKFCLKLTFSSKIIMLEGGRNIQLKGKQDLSVVTPRRAGASAVELHREGKLS